MTLSIVLTTRWEKQWRWKPATLSWKRTVRFVAREYRWQKKNGEMTYSRQELAVPMAGCMVDDLALRISGRDAAATSKRSAQCVPFWSQRLIVSSSKTCVKEVLRKSHLRPS